MKQVIYIGGGDGYSDREDFLKALQTQEIRDPFGEDVKRWASTLRDELLPEFQLMKMQMPNKQNAKYDEWKIWFERHREFMSGELVMVGYSLGGMFLYKYLSENECNKNILALVTLASPAGQYDDGSGNDCATFRFDLKSLSERLSHIAQITIMHSKDDFVVPFSHGEQLHAAIPGSKFVTFEDKSHFLVEQLPELIELIKGVGRGA